MHTPARASARARAGTQKTDKQTRQTRGKENRLGLGAMILSIELPPKLPPLFALRPPSLPPKMLARWRRGRGDAQDGGGRERGNLGPIRAESGSLLGWLTCFQRLRVVSRYLSPGQLQAHLLRRNEQQGAMAQWQRV